MFPPDFVNFKAFDNKLFRTWCILDSTTNNSQSCIVLNHCVSTIATLSKCDRNSLAVEVDGQILLNMLSRLIITFLPRSKRLLISWLQSPSAVILEPPKNKVCHCFHCFPIYFP